MDTFSTKQFFLINVHIFNGANNNVSELTFIKKKGGQILHFNPAYLHIIIT